MLGSDRIQFWGIVQKYFPFVKTSVRRSLRESFPVIPLITDPDENLDLMTLRQRVKYLEMMLQEYVVDDYPLQQIAANLPESVENELDIREEGSTLASDNILKP